MGPTPDERARSAEIRRLLQERIDWHEEQRRLRRERAERHRRRIRRLSLGLLGRS